MWTTIIICLFAWCAFNLVSRISISIDRLSYSVDQIRESLLDIEREFKEFERINHFQMDCLHGRASAIEDKLNDFSSDIGKISYLEYISNDLERLNKIKDDINQINFHTDIACDRLKDIWSTVDSIELAMTPPWRPEPSEDTLDVDENG